MRLALARRWRKPRELERPLVPRLGLVRRRSLALMPPVLLLRTGASRMKLTRLAQAKEARAMGRSHVAGGARVSMTSRQQHCARWPPAQIHLPGHAARLFRQ